MTVGSAARAIHLEVPFKVSAVGYYVNTACGAYMLTMTDQAASRTDDARKVTCRGCQRTRAYSAALDGEAGG